MKNSIFILNNLSLEYTQLPTLLAIWYSVQLHFLIFHVRQPKLILCMMADRNRHTTGYESWTPHVGQSNPTYEATAMVAAVMDTVAGVKPCLRDDLSVCFSEDARVHEANMRRLPRDADRWWRELLTELYQMLPFYPKPVRTCVGEVVSHCNPPQGFPLRLMPSNLSQDMVLKMEK